MGWAGGKQGSGSWGLQDASKSPGEAGVRGAAWAGMWEPAGPSGSAGSTAKGAPVSCAQQAGPVPLGSWELLFCPWRLAAWEGHSREGESVLAVFPVASGCWQERRRAPKTFTVRPRRVLVLQ